MTFQLHAKFESMLVASKNVEIKSLQLYLLYLLDKIWNHLSVVNRDAETDTLTVRMFRSKHDFSARMLRSKHGSVNQNLV